MSETEQNLIRRPSSVAGPLIVEESFAPEQRGPGRYENLSGLLNVLRHRWKLTAIATGLVFVLGLGAYALIASYTATTIIEVNKDDPSDNDAAQSNGPVLNSDDIKDEVQTDVSILQTDDTLALAVIEKLNLLNEPFFRKAADSAEKGLPLDRAPHTRDNALSIFHRHLKVESPADSRLITIKFKSHDPALSAHITNTLAHTFIDDTIYRRRRSILSSSSWLQHELGELKARVQKSQQELADYERTTGLAGIQVTGANNANGNTSVTVTPQNTVTERLLTLNQELTAAEANRISTETVNRLIKSNDPDLVIGLGPMAVSNANGPASSITPESIALLSQFRAQQTDLQRQLSAATVKYGENNPRRIELQSQVDSVQNQINAELGRMRKRAANASSYAKTNEASIRYKFQQQQSAANDLADKSVKLQLLAQEAFSNQSLYENLFSKLQTATLAAGTHATRIDFVADAIPPGSPNSPKLPMYLAALAGMSIFIGVTVTFLRESQDQTVRTLEDVSEIKGRVFPGYIPRSRSLGSEEMPSRSSELITAPGSPFSEAFRSLRTSLDLTLSRTWPRTILITSALGSAGKSTVAYNLAVAYAQQGSKILLVDADLRNPDLHHFFTTPLSPGLREACTQPESEEIAGIRQHPGLPTLSFLSAGERPQFPSELFASPGFSKLLNRLSKSFDYVLIDSPPILAVTDASIIATKVNSVIAIVRSRNTTRLAVSAVAHALERAQVPLQAFVLNDVDKPALDGFYEYSYSRGKGGQLAQSA